MIKRLILLLTCCLMILSTMIISCGGEEIAEEEAPEAARTYGTLRVASESFGEETYDPNNNVATWSACIYDNVMNWDAEGGLVGEAAQSWTISADGRTWTFKVRPGTKFHNGDPVTSADFAYSVDRFMDPESTNPWAPRVAENFESSSTPDDNTYVHTTKTPELTLVASWAALPILPSKYIQENGWDYFAANPIGSGPWKYVELIPETSMEFEAYEDYWDGAPYFEKCIFYQVPEEATAVAMLKRDEIDLVYVSMDRTVELRDEGYRLQEIGLPTIGIYAFQGTWMTDGPTKDIRVRQAMSYAINRQEVCDTFLHGLGKNSGCGWFMSDVTWGWDPTWSKADPYDPERAKQLLEDAGYPDAFATPTIHLYTPEQWSDEMLICQGYWEAIGLDVEIQIGEMGKFYDLMFARADSPDDECVGQIWPWISPTVFQNVYHSSNMFTSLGVHTTANDPEMDELYNAVLAETDIVKQERLWTEFIEKGREMWIVTGLWEQPSYWVVSDHLGDFTKRAHIFITNCLYGIKHAD
ncbi:MAG: ABC transporter substrate-binding protein [Dehalococcoidales bacterium]|nr:MAG: ABC transporter substrate-binding protein [Dehalococcoidales bacterium]